VDTLACNLRWDPILLSQPDEGEELLGYFKQCGHGLTIGEGVENLELELEPELFARDGAILTADIYAHNDHRHPDTHLGLVEFFSEGGLQSHRTGL